MFFSGGFGNSWWGNDLPEVLSFLDDLRNHGYGVVQVRWNRGWLLAGEEVGPARLACRPATVVQWVFDNLYAPLGVDAPNQHCGFCITGNSGGSSQVSYALTHYGLDRVLNGVFPTSGPVHSALAQACLNPAGDPLSYAGSAGAEIIDRSYGFSSNGPCVRQDGSYKPNWDRDSVDTNGSDYSHQRTRVQVLLGEFDTAGHPHANVYVNRLVSSGTPAEAQIVAQMGHEVADSVSGRAALRAAILR